MLLIALNALGSCEEHTAFYITLFILLMQIIDQLRINNFSLSSGDGNLHLQISVRKFSNEVLNFIEPYIYKRVEELKGSISAEHGIGFSKKKYLPMIKSKATISAMRNLKELMDPKGILNPYKVL